MGWFLITIALPLLAPVVLMLCLKALPLPVAPAQMSLLTPVKDGQLCWGAIGFCASALYEISVPGELGILVDQRYAGYLTAGFIIMLVISSLFAACGAIFSIPLGCPAGMPWYKYYKALAVSLAMTGLSGAAYAVVHYGLLMPAQD